MLFRSAEATSRSNQNENGVHVYRGILDQGYSGEIVVKLYNHGDEDYWVNEGEKISQLVIVPVRYEEIKIVDRITGGERGNNGFGSTGK